MQEIIGIIYRRVTLLLRLNAYSVKLNGKPKKTLGCVVSDTQTSELPSCGAAILGFMMHAWNRRNATLADE